jgi:cold shock CspA family protein
MVAKVIRLPSSPVVVLSRRPPEDRQTYTQPGHVGAIRRRSRSRSRSRSRGGSRGRGGGGGGGGGGAVVEGVRYKGTACRWNPRGFGFITPKDGGEDIFCHVSVITDGNALREGDEIEYEVRLTGPL